ncbi:MAG: SpoIIE family protein phosphatase [Phreatobacter sp.]|uniref:SpoIIE family protein phosphatase n=1 Tax=Phreatobacter sp. TaxID=1966341 RepID=UPI0027372B87|nr:SpoIIE family protein phosphatase [Phreatobacter sp.]MDP2800830.1 SpoIIE family protein phosphatase [Phreatobacter sp.]
MAPAVLVVRMTDEEVDRTRLDFQKALWLRSIDSGSPALADAARSLAEDAEMSALRTRQDRAGTAARLATLLPRHQREADVSRIDVVGRDGQLLTTSQTGAVDAPLVDAVAVIRETENRSVVAGIEAIAGGRLIAVVNHRLPDGGFVTVAGPLAPLAAGFENAIGEEVYVVTLGQGLIYGPSSIWDTVRPLISSSGGIDEVRLGGRWYQFVPLSITNSFGSVIGTVYSRRDITVVHQQKTIVLMATLSLSMLLFLVLITWLYAYLQNSLRPLTEVTDAVRALARGDAMVSVEVPSNADEIGRIAEAVEVFRRNAKQIALEDFRSRIQRAHQHNLIHGEMQRLAGTLEPAARDELINDLGQIEQQSKSADGNGSATDAMLTVAFKIMAERVVDQHQRLSVMLQERTADLEIVREALAQRTQLNRLREEFEVARELQLSSLPKTFPPFPDRREFDLYAAMRPAKEVGGDFFDFTLLDSHRLAVFVGDASGKGMSAAMFILTARSLLRSSITRGVPIAECLALANNTLAFENDTMMFATIFIAVLDLSTGQLVCSNAGHNPPYIRRRNGEIVCLSEQTGIALGVMEDATFVQQNHRMEPGDTLLMFSDGVTEAADSRDRLFDETRLVTTLKTHGARDAKSLTDNIFMALDTFVGTAEQADDITVLALRLMHLQSRVLPIQRASLAV